MATCNKKYMPPPRSCLHSRIVSVPCSEPANQILTSLMILLVKSGYPPQPLTLIPELPLSSLGLRSGDQIIVSASAEANVTRSGPASPPNQRSAPPPSAQKRSDPAPGNPKSAPQPSGGQADHVQTDGGVLIHRVSNTLKPAQHPPRIVI